jgi:hypothetical protein
MIYSVGIDVHKGQHRVYCLDEKAQVCDVFSFQTTPEELATWSSEFPGTVPTLSWSLDLPGCRG